jgi:hypothetical protein
MGVSSVGRWVKHFKDGNRHIADHRAVVDRELLQLSATSKKLKSSSGKERKITVTEIAAQLGVGHHTVQEMMEILGYWKVCSRLVPRLLTGKEEHKMSGNWSPIHPTVGIWPPSDYHLFGPLKDHLRGHHYETDEAVQEAVQSRLRGPGTDFYRRGIFKILQRWQKRKNWDGDFVEK